MCGGGQCLIESHATLRPEMSSKVLGEWKKWIAESFLEELVNNFLLFSGIGN